jgi:hypothetical protein
VILVLGGQERVAYADQPASAAAAANEARRARHTAQPRDGDKHGADDAALG